MARAPKTPTPFGRLLRFRRRMLGMSQEELARRAEISGRHLSYVETGRAAPSREMVIAVAYALDVEDEGLFLEAAGFLAPYPDVDLSAPELAGFMRDLRAVVDRQLHPALVHDRFGTILHHNRVFEAVVGKLSELPLASEQASGHRLLADLRPLVGNWEPIGALYRRRLFRELVRGSGELADDILEQLYQQLDGNEQKGEVLPRPLTPIHLRTPAGRVPELTLRFDFVTVTLGTPQDIGLRNYRMVMFLPADDATERCVALSRS